MYAASLALQRAIFETLSHDENLKEKVTGIFDNISFDQSLPFIVIGDDTITDWSAKGFLGSEHRVSIHIWSASPGRQEVKEIGSLVHHNMKDSNLYPIGYSLVSLLFIRNFILTDKNKRYQHSILEYRARLTPIQ